MCIVNSPRWLYCDWFDISKHFTLNLFSLSLLYISEYCMNNKNLISTTVVRKKKPLNWNVRKATPLDLIYCPKQIMATTSHIHPYMKETWDRLKKRHRLDFILLVRQYIPTKTVHNLHWILEIFCIDAASRIMHTDRLVKPYTV